MYGQKPLLALKLGLSLQTGFPTDDRIMCISSKLLCDLRCSYAHTYSYTHSYITTIVSLLLQRVRSCVATFQILLVKCSHLIVVFVVTIVCIRFSHISSAELVCDVNADDMQ